jgi:hypothetical protein
MPMIDMTYVRGSLEQQALGRLTDELVTVLLRAEQVPDTRTCGTTPWCICTSWIRPRSRWVAAARGRPDSGWR